MIRTVNYTTSASGAQNGYALGGLWIDNTDEFFVTNLGSPDTHIGMVFSWGLGFDEVGRPIDPPVLLGELTLTLTTSARVVNDPGTEILELYVVPEAAPALYSASLLPFDRDELLVASTSAVWTGPATQVVFDLTDVETLRMLYWASSRWNGKIALSLKAVGVTTQWTFATGITATPPTLASVEDSFHTGVSGWSLDKGRNRRCFVTGKPLLAQDAVQDGYRDEVMLSPEAWDPEDRSQKDFHPPASEGEIDDELS